MRMTIDQIIGERQELREGHEADLADEMVRTAVEPAWHLEILRRIADLESGRTRGIPLEETLAKARAVTDP